MKTWDCPGPGPGQGPPCRQGAAGAAAGRAQPSPRAHMGAPDVAAAPQLERERSPEERREEEKEEEEEGFCGARSYLRAWLSALAVQSHSPGESPPSLRSSRPPASPRCPAS